MNDELMRKISDALDAEGGLDGDEDLRALLAEDDEALAYAQDLVRIDEVLKSFGERTLEPDWDALADRIEARLDEPLDDLAIDAPPFADEAPARSPSIRREVAVAPAAAMAAPPPAERAPAPVVDLSARRKPAVFAWLGGLAAAAAVGLGITFGVTTLDEPAAEMAAAPAMQEAAPAPAALPAEAVPAWGGVAAEEPAAVGEGALPAAATAQPALAAAPTPVAPAPEPPRMPRARGARYDDMMVRERSAGSGGGGAAVEMPAAEPPAPPSRAQILTALRSAEPTVQRCLARRGEVAQVALQVGADGTVMSVRVSPPYVGAEAACIVDALHGVRMPASATDYPFAYAFRPAPMAGGSLARPPAAARRAAPAAARETQVDNAFAR